ncbi:MAG: hypothetical protein H8E58_02340 [SAR92 clade bacterium]|nr:hypothetical protein [SAR92 clade bacterium]
MKKEELLTNIVKDLSVGDLINLISNYQKEIQEHENFIESLLMDEGDKDTKIRKLEDELNEVVEERARLKRRMYGRNSRFNKKVKNLKNEFEKKERIYELERLVRVA